MTNPVTPMLVDVLASALAKRGVQAPGAVAIDAAKDMLADPAIKNQMNAESPLQSRVFYGSVASVLGAAAIVWQQVETRQFDAATLGPAIAILVGAAYALYGRLKTGLKPLFSRGK